MNRFREMLLTGTALDAVGVCYTGSGFQTAVSVQPAMAVEGDFASKNPRFTLNVGPGGLVAGANGLVVGRFAWTAPPQDADGTNAIASNTGSGSVAGFVGREQQGLITTYLSASGMTIQKGFGCTLYVGGDFWVKNNGTTQAAVGNKAYASFADGSVSFAATGTVTNASLTGSIGAGLATFTGSITNNILTVTAVAGGTLVAGGLLAGTGGGGVASGTHITSQISGTIGGVGTYYIDVPEQTVTSTTITEAYGLMTVASVSSGNIYVGAPVSGTGGGGVTAGTTVTQLATGTGQTGTYYVNTSQTVSAGTALTIGTNVETKWYAMSVGAVGELVKISDHATG